MTNQLQITSLNVRGLGDKTKRRQLFHWLKQYHEGVIFLQETHSTATTEQQWEKEWGSNIIFAHGTSSARGVAILFPQKYNVKVNSKISDKEGRYAVVDLHIETQNIILINIYAPTKDKEKDQLDFLNTLIDTLKNYTDNNIIIGGDFNTYLDPERDKKGGRVEKATRYAKDIIDLQESFHLIDIWRVRNPDSNQYTWRRRNPQLIQARLDFWLISNHISANVTTCSIKPSIKSDHSLIKLKIELWKEEKRGRGFWKFNSSLLKDLEYVGKINDLIAELKTKYENLKDKALKWDTIKTEIRSETISYAAYKSKKTKMTEANLLQQIDNLEKEIAINPSESTLHKYEKTKIEIEAINAHKTKGAHIRSKARWLEEGERTTKYFLAIEKRNSKGKNISKLINEKEETLTDPRQILKEEKRFYEKLYEENNAYTNLLNEDVFLEQPSIKRLNNEQKDICDEEITIIECGEALSSLKNDKSPGTDGFTAEFYKFFWRHIANLVFDSFKYALEHGRLSIEQRRGILSLLPKEGKDIRFLKNWRPIALLNTDYKIITKLLAKRLQPILPDIIHTDQTGYVEDRYIGENIRKIEDIIYYTNIHQKPGILLLIDFEKAFDSINWKYLLKALKSFNFGDTFCRWIRILYTDIQSCVLNNGHSSEFFYTGKGIRQGCPLSAFLFTIAVELLAVKIRNDPNIKGIRIGNCEIKLSQLADDTSIFIEDVTSLGLVLNTLFTFYTVAGLKLNRNKTEAVWLGMLANRDLKPFRIKWVTNFQSLGIKFSSIKIPNSTEENFETRIKAIEKCLNLHRIRDLSWKGRITILKALAAPKILYAVTNLHVPEELIKRVNTMFYKFLWKGNRIKRNVIISRKEEGGLEMIDFESKIKSSKLMWIKRLLSKDNILRNSIEEQIGMKLNDILKCSLNKKEINTFKIPPFYKDILLYWNEIMEDNEINGRSNVLWYNKNIKINNKVVFYKRWYDKGIMYVRDLFDKYGKPKSKIRLNEQYGLNISVMDLNSILHAIPRDWKINIINDTIGLHENELSIKLGEKIHKIQDMQSKHIYWHLVNKKSDPPICIDRWEENFNCVNINWKLIFKMPHQISRDTKVHSFQYKIIHRVFPCNAYVSKWSPNTSINCERCQLPDTLEHYFVTCNQSKQFWSSLNIWWEQNFQQKIPLSTKDIILGIENTTDNNVLMWLNIIILHGKYYISIQKYRKNQIHFTYFLKYLKNYLEGEKLIASLENRDYFGKKWGELYNKVD